MLSAPSFSPKAPSVIASVFDDFDKYAMKKYELDRQEAMQNQKYEKELELAREKLRLELEKEAERIKAKVNEFEGKRARIRKDMGLSDEPPSEDQFRVPVGDETDNSQSEVDKAALERARERWKREGLVANALALGNNLDVAEKGARGNFYRNRVEEAEGPVDAAKWERAESGRDRFTVKDDMIIDELGDEGIRPSPIGEAKINEYESRARLNEERAKQKPQESKAKSQRELAVDARYRLARIAGYNDQDAAAIALGQKALSQSDVLRIAERAAKAAASNELDPTKKQQRYDETFNSVLERFGASGARAGSVPQRPGSSRPMYKDGKPLMGKDGRIYIMKNGRPVPVE